MITIYKHSRNQTIALYLYSEVLKLLDSKEIVVEVVNSIIRIRAASLLDNNSRKIPRSNIISFAVDDCDMYLGKYNVEQEGDWFYLEKIK